MKCSCQILMLLICTMVLLFNCQFYGMISYTLNLGCTDTPFLVSCWCWTCVGHRNGYDSPDSGVRRVASFFFFFSFFRHGSDASDTPAVEKKKIPGYLSSFRQFRRIAVCFGGKLVPGRYKMNEFFFPEYFRYLHIFIFGVLDDHDSPNFSLQDHPSLLLPPFNRATV